MDRNSFVEEIYQFICENSLCAGIVKYFGARGKMQMDFAESVYTSKIEDLELSVRSFHGLKRAGIDTIEQLLNAVNDGTLSSVRNLGAKSCNEISIKILEFGYNNFSEKDKKAFIRNLIDINLIDCGV